MDLLADLLTPYKDIIATTATVVTTAHFFSGAVICYDIKKQGNTKGFDAMPFLGGLVLGILNLKYGTMLRDDAMITVNFGGIALNIIYMMVFYAYSLNKTTVWLQLGASGAFTAVLIGYTEWEQPDLVEHRFGLILTALMLMLIGSPLLGLRSIIKKKSTEGMPFPIILSGTLVTFLWLLYGIILRNSFLLFQNVVGLVLCVIQLSLFAIYPSKPAEGKATGKTSGKAKAKKTN